ncbi:MAG: TetR/AcrR family transcriptional regulator C-terminal domain-containing protein [Acidimicrobiales bacterium]|nr:TetR/AcrR family transcriptional regulator C-terminal domain-containing protein [Acidimicrobiales bacterium]MDG1875870.1 TetR/AcrR family transcriptional regulator C-terminal domain-containing protein [Acidimicrobiales bacterium]
MTVVERLPLSRERIADTALQFIDDHGLAALSMRKLGAELGVEAMSLYNHVANKDDLLDSVGNALYTQVLVAYGDPAGDWRTKARRIAASYVEVASAHPRALPVLLNRSPEAPARLEFLDRVVAIFDDVTEDLRVAALAFSVVANWVVGTLVQQFDAASGDAPEPAVEGFERVAAFRMALLVEIGRDERFEEGLEAVLDGIASRYFPAD